jgi:hypothetical protein
MHIRYVQIVRTEEMTDVEVERMIKGKVDNKLIAEKFLENATKKLTELQAEQKLITEKAARFGSFLKHNAILTHNEAVKEYLKLAIHEADRIAKETRDFRQVEGLQASLKQYEEQKEIIEYCIANGTETIEAVDIKRDYKELFQLKNMGPNLKALFEAEESGQQNQVGGMPLGKLIT